MKAWVASNITCLDDIGRCICELYFIPSEMKRFVTDGVILFPCTAHECSPSRFPSLTDVGGGPRGTPLSFNWFGCLNPLGMVVGCDGGNGDGGFSCVLLHGSSETCCRGLINILHAYICIHSYIEGWHEWAPCTALRGAGRKYFHKSRLVSDSDAMPAWVPSRQHCCGCAHTLCKIH